jgi:hypothetical protein
MLEKGAGRRMEHYAASHSWRLVHPRWWRWVASRPPRGRGEAIWTTGHCDSGDRCIDEVNLAADDGAWQRSDSYRYRRLSAPTWSISGQPERPFITRGVSAGCVATCGAWSCRCPGSCITTWSVRDVSGHGAHGRPSRNDGCGPRPQWTPPRQSVGLRLSA